MDVITFSEARSKLQAIMDRVVEDHTPVVVARHKAEAVVLVSLSDWRAIEATARLLSSPANASRLLDAIAELDAGSGVEQELLWP